MGILGKPGWLLVLLAGAFLIPYVLLDKQFAATVNKALGRAPENAPAGNPSTAAVTAAGPISEATPAVSVEPSAPLCDMASAFRFEITPQWVTAAWPRVSTVVGDTSNAGMRVPLVTGVMPDDLVGTLTYYFDDEQRLQRMTFAGNTGDPRRLVALVTSQYGLVSQPTLDAGLYQTKWNGKSISTLHVRRAAVVSATAAHGKFDVELELKRADALAGTASAPRKLFGW